MRRGVAERRPKKYALDEDEIKRVSKLARVPPEEMAKEMARLQAELANAKGDDDADAELDGGRRSGAYVSGMASHGRHLLKTRSERQLRLMPWTRINRRTSLMERIRTISRAYKLDEYDDDPKSGCMCFSWQLHTEY